MKKALPNVHPGEVLLEEFLKAIGISQDALARAIDVPPRRINEIVLGKRAISADTALRLARALRTSEQFWMGLQADYDLEEAKNAAGDELRKVRSLAAGDPSKSVIHVLDRYIPTETFFERCPTA